MNITSKQCQEFKSNPTVNPLTGRHIAIGKITHNRLTEACSTTKSIKKSKSNDYEVPPIGPMIHWELKARSDREERNNLIKILNYINTRLDVIDNRKTNESKLEMNEFNDILKISKDIFEDKKDTLTFVNNLIKDVQDVYKDKVLVDDVPKKTIISGLHVIPHRIGTRKNVLYALNVTNSLIATFNEAIQENKIFNTVPYGEFVRVSSFKKFLDYLIKHKIFTHDDIYKNTFKSDKIFDELKDKYEKYKVIYKAFYKE
jgi:hypothetical protein